MRLSLYVLALVCALGSVSVAEAKKTKWVEVPASKGQIELPTCLDGDRRPIQGNNNEEVLRWKETTENQYKDRALVDGVLVGVLLDRRSHLQLEVNLAGHGQSAGREEHIEIIYNKAFGDVLSVEPGMQVQACGDYITANRQAGPYKPSPVGAIIHWVHKSNNPGRHVSGFLAIDGSLYGMEDEEGRGRQGEEQNLVDFSGFLQPWL